MSTRSRELKILWIGVAAGIAICLVAATTPLWLSGLIGGLIGSSLEALKNHLVEAPPDGKAMDPEL